MHGNLTGMDANVVGFLWGWKQMLQDSHGDVKTAWYSRITILYFYGIHLHQYVNQTQFFQMQEPEYMLKLPWQCKLKHQFS